MNWKFWEKSKEKKNEGPKSKTREWADAIIFAVVASSVVGDIVLFDVLDFLFADTGNPDQFSCGNIIFKFHVGANRPINADVLCYELN